MRTLSFDVDGQIIKKNENCNFDDIVPGTKGYLQARFSFSSEWKDTVRVAEFTRGRYECTPQILDNGTTCIIPEDALTSREFAIRVIGRRGDDFTIVTNRISVRQEGGMTHE